MIVGHTKFSPDWCFGLLKQRLRRCEYNCLNDIAREVENSADVNSAQLIRTQSGEQLVPTYNWANYFHPYFRPFQNIKQYHHFKFTPTAFTVKKYSNHESLDFHILRTNWTPSFTELPQIIIPAGLSEERKIYLYNNIRPFCREELRDSVFPKPPLVTPHLNISQTRTSSPPSPSSPLSKKRKVACSICGQTTHNKRTCPTLKI